MVHPTLAGVDLVTMKTHHALLFVSLVACGSTPSTSISGPDAGQDVATVPDVAVPDLGTPSGDSSDNTDSWVAGDSGLPSGDGSESDQWAPKVGPSDAPVVVDAGSPTEASRDVVVDVEAPDAGCQATYEACIAACGSNCGEWDCRWDCKRALDTCLGDAGSSGCGH
jgi:hypothetical protein